MIAGGIALLGAALIPAVATAARAVIGGARCEGVQTLTYFPGLTTVPMAARAKGPMIFTTCVSNDTGISKGISEISSNGELSCAEGTYTGEQTIEWNNGQTSTLSFISVNFLGQGIVAISGKVIAGEFNGYRWRETFTILRATSSSCRTRAGFGTAYGPFVLSIGAI